MIPLITLVLILSSLILTLTWHNTQINRKCSGPKCFRLCGSNILFEIELENGVTACGDTGGRGATGSNAGVGGRAAGSMGALLTPERLALQRVTHIQLFCWLRICCFSS